MLLPLSKPGIASVIIFQFMNIWNDMFLPLVIIQDPKLRTLTLGLLKFKEQYQRTDFIKMFSALVMINIPIIIVYIIFQRQFISGLTSGSVKS
jgi:ABC-type glycerol-3-phosphate transport system permease component